MTCPLVSVHAQEECRRRHRAFSDLLRSWHRDPLAGVRNDIHRLRRRTHCRTRSKRNRPHGQGSNVEQELPSLKQEAGDGYGIAVKGAVIMRATKGALLAREILSALIVIMAMAFVLSLEFRL